MQFRNLVGIANMNRALGDFGREGRGTWRKRCIFTIVMQHLHIHLDGWC